MTVANKDTVFSSHLLAHILGLNTRFIASGESTDGFFIHGPWYEVALFVGRVKIVNKNNIVIFIRFMRKQHLALDKDRRCSNSEIATKAIISDRVNEKRQPIPFSNNNHAMNQKNEAFPEAEQILFYKNNICNVMGTECAMHNSSIFVWMRCDLVFRPRINVSHHHSNNVCGVNDRAILFRFVTNL